MRPSRFSSNASREIAKRMRDAAVAAPSVAAKALTVAPNLMMSAKPEPM